MLLIPTQLAILVCTHLVPYYFEGVRVGVPEMQKRFNVNPRTLNPALRTLVHAGILNSRTGGLDRGYILARDPKSISVYDIVHLIQGEPKVECCVETHGCMNCEAVKCSNGYCKIFNRLNSVLEISRQEIGKISLYDQYYNK
ncbi:MAG: Rrf2 family transcriptional regulator [Rikenellaceae bacterium]